jgi:sec-independent protein translocase protein TatB
MFEIGFWELVLIGLVALLVVGPERLPALARTLGVWTGRLRRMVAQVKEDIEREIRADELRKSLDEARSLREAYETLEDTKRDLEGAARSLDEAGREVAAAGRAGIEPESRPDRTEAAGPGVTTDEAPGAAGEQREGASAAAGTNGSETKEPGTEPPDDSGPAVLTEGAGGAEGTEGPGEREAGEEPRADGRRAGT